ncbi:hypothetical protein RvY_13423 [Ramazzottius varieornatus]|uniref:Uncharacterized protein n=1 Tax=Ramazzottius varieornatus TaxID=947166 RepID=A0A1D1VPN7_RAMVA|nr:hypothetical protein RvY_13423 [Ramazzottius varieornatus]
MLSRLALHVPLLLGYHEHCERTSAWQQQQHRLDTCEPLQSERKTTQLAGEKLHDIYLPKRTLHTGLLENMATSIHIHVKEHCAGLRKRVQERVPQYKRDYGELSQLLDVYDATLCTFCDSEDGEEMFAPLWTFYDPESCVITPCLRPEFEETCLTFIRDSYQTVNQKILSRLWALKLLSDYPTTLSHEVISRVQDEQILSSHKRHVYCHQDGSLIKLWRKMLTVAPTALRALGKTIAKESSLAAPQSLTPEFIFNTVQALIRKLNYNMHVSPESTPDFAEMELDPVVLDDQLYSDSKTLCEFDSVRSHCMSL